MVYIGELYVKYLFSKPVFIFDQVGISCKWANDGQRLLLEWFDAIRDSPSQVYHLALPFCPSSSWLGKFYATELSQEVKVVGLPARWGACSRTVTLDDELRALTCWKNTIVVGLSSGDIVILDRITGIQTAILSGHADWVRCLVFSPDGTSLVSGSDDRTVKLWDVQTGGTVKTFHGHAHFVLSVSISADKTMIASGSWDKAVYLWNIQTEECHHVIEQQDPVYHVMFSLTDPQHLISAAGNKVWYWDINGHQTNPPHNGSNIAFSSDGTQFVLCQGGDVIVQNSSSGAIVAKFHIANSHADHCCFSPDGRLIAAVAVNTAYVWDTTNSHPYPINTFVGHTAFITSLAFSSPSSLISSSKDKSVKFWQVGALQTESAVTDPECTLLSPAKIMSITIQAEGDVVISSDSKGVVRTWDILTGLCKTSIQTPARNPMCSDVQSINSCMLFIWYADEEIHMWDVEKGELLQKVGVTLDSPDGVENVRISGDGSTIYCLRWEVMQALSVLTGEVVGEVGLEFCELQRSLSVDGSSIWVHSPISEPLGWDFGILGSPVQLSHSSLLHPNKTKLWHVDQSRIIDTVTGKVVLQLAGRLVGPTASQWDGQHLVAGYESGEVLILDFSHMFL